jgi:hypothetical protein
MKQRALLPPSAELKVHRVSGFRLETRESGRTGNNLQHLLGDSRSGGFPPSRE